MGEAIDSEVVIIAGGSELAAAEGMFGHKLKEMAIIAWTIEAVDALRAGRYRYEFATLFQDGEDFDRAAKRFEGLNEWSRCLDDQLSTSSPNVKKLRLRFFHNKIHTLKYILNEIWNEVDKLGALADMYPGKRIHYFKSNKKKEFSVLNELESLSSDRNSNFNTFVGYELPTSALRGERNVAGPPDWMEKYDPLSRLRMKCRETRKYGRLPFRGRNSRGPWQGDRAGRVNRVLVLSAPSEDLDERLRRWARLSNDEIVVWRPERLNELPQLDFSVEKFFSSVSADRFVREWLVCDGLDFYGRIELFLRKFISSDLALHIRYAERFNAVHEDKHIDFVVHAYVHPLWEGILDQCGYASVPAAYYLHGGNVGHFKGRPRITPYVRGMTDKSDFYFCVYSNAIADYLNKAKDIYPNFNANIVAVGSSHYSKMISKNRSIQVNRKRCAPIRVMYICGPLGIMAANDNKHGSYDDPVIYELRRRLLDDFGDCPQIELTFRMGSYAHHGKVARTIFDQYVQNGNFSNVRVNFNEDQLIHCFKKCDLVVLERPGTVLYESLTTSLPVVLLQDARGLQFTEHAQNLISKRITCSRSMDELIGALRDVKERGFSAPVFTDKDHKDHRFIDTFSVAREMKNNSEDERSFSDMLALRSSPAAEFKHKRGDVSVAGLQGQA